MTTIGISTLTKRFQEIEITKNFLLDFYRWGSRMNLMAADYGLPSNASMIEIIKAVGDQIGASNSWYWFDDYDVNRIVDLVILNMNIVSMKQAKYSN